MTSERTRKLIRGWVAMQRAWPAYSPLIFHRSTESSQRTGEPERGAPAAERDGRRGPATS